MGTLTLSYLVFPQVSIHPLLTSCACRHL